MPESCPFLFTTEYLLAQQLTQQEQGCQGAVILPMVSKNISAKQYIQLNNKNDLEKTQLFFPSPTFFLPVILVQRSYGWQTILKPLRNKLGGKNWEFLVFKLYHRLAEKLRLYFLVCTNSKRGRVGSAANYLWAFPNCFSSSWNLFYRPQRSFQLNLFHC